MSTYLASKPRYEILDGLRGVAAMMVVAFHLFETYFHMGPDQPINHGYLAVDFFFALSGFVIGYAYDDRWDKMSLKNFFKRRLVRLHPMLIFGTLVGLVLFYCGGDFAEFGKVNETPWYSLLLVCLVCLTMFPLPASFDIRGWGEFNPLNGASWSLLWEYFANVCYALFIRRFSNLLLGIFVGVSAALTVILCFDIDVFGVLEARSWAKHTVVGGWSLSADQLQVGFTRLLYPFFAGLLLSRIKKFITFKGGFWICSLAVVVLLAMPRVGGADEQNFCMNGAYEAFSILIMFPLILAVGAGSEIKGNASKKICAFLGDISYPLYITHYPLIYWQMSWAATHQDLPASTHVFFAVSIFVIAIGIAYASLKLYDLPVREWLRKRWF